MLNTRAKNEYRTIVTISDMITKLTLFLYPKTHEIKMIRPKVEIMYPMVSIKNIYKKVAATIVMNFFQLIVFSLLLLFLTILFPFRLENKSIRDKTARISESISGKNFGPGGIC